MQNIVGKITFGPQTKTSTKALPMNTLEIIRKVEVLEQQAQDCIVVADTVTARLNVIHAQLTDIVNDFWGEKSVEAQELGADDTGKGGGNAG